MVLKVAGNQAGYGLLLWRELIGRHRLDRQPRQQTLSTVLPLAQHHLAKGQVVVNGRDETASARWEQGWMAPLAAPRLVGQLQRASLRIGGIAGHQPIELG